MADSTKNLSIYDKLSKTWIETLVTQQLHARNGTSTIEFTNSMHYLENISNSDQDGCIYLYHDKSKKIIIPIYFRARKFTLNDGTRFIPSQIKNISLDPQSTFFNDINTFNYDLSSIIITQMNWIESVIIHLGPLEVEFITKNQFLRDLTKYLESNVNDETTSTNINTNTNSNTNPNPNTMNGKEKTKSKDENDENDIKENNNNDNNNNSNKTNPASKPTNPSNTIKSKKL